MVSRPERIPVTLLGGYLGAGKTTILNRLLATAPADDRLAVLVNDVGAVGVDAALIADHDGTTMSLTNGCVCCSIADDLVTTLETVRRLTPRPDRLVMELSGAAEPARVAPWSNTTGFRLDGIVVAVDAEQFPDQLARRYVGDTVAAQVGAADVLMVTKTDLVDRASVDRVRSLVREHSAAPLIEAAPGRAPIGAVFGLDRIGAAGGPRAEPGEAPPVSTSIVDLGGMDRAVVERVLDALPPTVVRAKGLVAWDGEVHVVHVVGPRKRIDRRPDLPPARADGRLVVIDLAG
jgi:G3E family GTPase